MLNSCENPQQFMAIADQNNTKKMHKIAECSSHKNLHCYSNLAVLSNFGYGYNWCMICIFQVRTWKMNAFTLIQLVCLGALWAIKSTPAALGFPFVLIMMVPIRFFVLKYFFTKQELSEVIDGYFFPFGDVLVLPVKRQLKNFEKQNHFFHPLSDFINNGWCPGSISL